MTLLLPTKVSPLNRRALRHSPGNLLFSIELQSRNSQSNFVAISVNTMNRAETQRHVLIPSRCQPCVFMWLGPISGYKVNTGLDHSSSPACMPILVRLLYTRPGAGGPPICRRAPARFAFLHCRWSTLISHSQNLPNRCP